MRACVLHNIAPITDRPLVLEDVPTPIPAAHEVLLDVHVCGVCRTDLHVIEGELDQARQVLPIIPGHQIVGAVVERGSHVRNVDIGQRVGAAWLHETCGTCRFCTHDQENLCPDAQFTGWTRQGGYAQYVAVPADFVYDLPRHLSATAIAPMMCAGIIGYRCLRLSGIDDWHGARLGIYGFGAAGHIALQIARARGAEVYVFTRDEATHQALATELGATWTGQPDVEPPQRLDAAIIFAPAGELVPAALGVLHPGGSVVCGGIHMSDTPPIPYRLLYDERLVRSVANNTRDDGWAFLEEAATIGLATHTQEYPLEDANEALIALKHGAHRGEAVLRVRED
jgi:propanol-preferring alcohol dehydrogenase